MDAEDWVDDGDWEFVCDGDFVYHRKRRRVDPACASSSSSDPPLPDPAAEEKARREWKKSALLKIKEKYQKELDRWELLSNNLRTLQEQSSQIEQKQREDRPSSSNQAADSSFGAAEPAESSSRRLIDDLLVQAEIHEATIRNLSYLCQEAEALCSAQEELVKKSFIDLPIWSWSPQELISSLCEDPDSPRNHQLDPSED